MRWWQRRMAALDLETTSKDPEDARIVSVSVAFVGGGVAVTEFSWLCDPGVEIPQEAVDVHGITTERARTEGKSLEVVLAAVASLLRTARDEGWALVVFNARYDLTVLDRELRRHGLAELASVLTELLVIDPMVLDRHIDKYRAGKRRLLEMCEVYSVALEGAHDAAYDAIAAARLAYRIGQRGRVVRRTRDEAEREEFITLTREWEMVRNDLGLLHEFQRRLAYESAVELEAYLHRGKPSKGVPPQPDRVVPRDWPLIPHDAPARPAPVPTQTRLDPLEQAYDDLSPEWTI